MKPGLHRPWRSVAIVSAVLVVVIPVGLALAGSTPADRSEVSGSAQGRTLVVDNDRVECQDAGFTTIPAALDAASPGDTVRVCAGTYARNVTIDTPDLTLRADGQVSIESAGWVVQVNASGVSVHGFEIDAVSGQGGVRLAGNDSLVANNSVHGAGAAGIRVQVHRSAVIRNNTVDNAPSVGYPPTGVLVNGSATVVGNTIQHARAGVFVQGAATVRANTITQTESGVDIANGANVTVIGNTLTGNYHTGVLVSSLTRYDLGKGGGRIVENRIANNRDGIIIGTAVDPGPYEFHRNVILNNANLGIHKGNFDVNDGEWPIVDARNNYWACGGPSGGLEDPVTGRVANGSGDPISAGDEEGVSNVHFDPFRVIDPSSCPSTTGTETPTPTPTPTRTPTPTPTPKSSPTPTSTPQPGKTATDTRAGTPTGTGPGSGDSDGGGGGDGGSGDDQPSGDGGLTPAGTSGGDATAIPSPSPSSSPSPSPSSPPTATPTQTPTLTPKPMVEPGFGVLSWMVGGIVLLAIVASRNRGQQYD